MRVKSGECTHNKTNSNWNDRDKKTPLCRLPYLAKKPQINTNLRAQGPDFHTLALWVPNALESVIASGSSKTGDSSSAVSTFSQRYGHNSKNRHPNCAILVAMKSRLKGL